MLYIIRGIPGSGKSTIANNLLKEGKVSAIVEADMYFIKDGEYKFDGTKIKNAHAWCKKTVIDNLQSGLNVAVANTFTRHWEYQEYVDFCKSNDIPYTIIVADGKYQNIHGVPSEIVKKMGERFEY